MPSNDQRRKAAKAKLERQLANRAERARKRRLIGVISTVVGVVVVVGVVYLLVNIGGDDDTSTAEQATPSGPGNCAYPVTEGKPAAKEATAPDPEQVKTEGTTPATIKLNGKDVPITLDQAKAPCTVASFASLAGQGYFDGTDCHRLTTGESLKVLQCGDPSGTGGGGPGYSFDDEVSADLTYPRGTLAMANSGPNTNGSQFFIVFGDSQLPPQYTVFGTVSEDGLKVVDEVAGQGVDGGASDGKPASPAKIDAVAIA
ncbi:peptidylprolyl isomerase [Actinokineospora pegani]|uniref:peptidylprolyl isomerase n=1 Tax=Actinokineospora pegani TaxID=2654637 RepID=UPI0012EA62FA|nr:peptidylprolyl isomerase [Actinokineospora pegani]